MARLAFRYMVTAFLFIVILGCSRRPAGKIDEPILRGKVSYKNAPVTGGKITLQSKDGKVDVPILADGSYNVRTLPEGEVAVVIETDSLKKSIDDYDSAVAAALAKLKEADAAMKAQAEASGKTVGGADKMSKEDFMQKMQEGAKASAGQPPTGKYVAIPKKYADPATSGLTVTVSKAPQQKNFELSD